MSDVIDLNAEREKRAEPTICEHVTRAKANEFFFGVSEANGDDPPMVMMSAFGGAFVFEEQDARDIGIALIELAGDLRTKRMKR